MRKTYNAKLVPMENYIRLNGIVVDNHGKVRIASYEHGSIPGWQAQRLVITDEAGADVSVYPKYELAPIPQIDLSDIRRWIDEGCKESVELEVYLTSDSHKVYGEFQRPDDDFPEKTWHEPTLTNNTVKMVWGEQDKAQPIAGEVELKDAATHYTDNNDRIDSEYFAFIAGANWRGHHPATDWDALEDKFNKWYSNQPTSVTGIDIFNFFKNEINGK